MVIVVDGRRDPDWPIPQVDGRGESSHMLVVDVSSESLAMWLALGCRDGKYDVGMPLARELSNLNRYTGDRKTAYDQGIDFRISDASEWSKKSRKPTAGDSCQTFDNGFLAIYADPPALVAYAGNPPQRVFAAAEHISHGFDPSIVFGVVTAIVSKIPIVGHVLAFATGWLAHQVHDSWLADENSDQDQMNKWKTLRSPVTDANGVKYDSICHATAAALASAFPVGPGASVAHPAGLGVEYALTDAQATQAALLISHGLSLTDAVARVRKDAAGAAASDPLLLAAAGAVAYGTHLI
jgi:hypothetical protein